MKKLNVSALNDFLTVLKKEYNVYAPIEKAGVTNFSEWRGEDVRINVLKTSKSAKNIFFPQVETMTTFVADGKTIDVRQEELCSESFIVFGVRACDCRAFAVLDKVFLAEPCDAFYSARRAHGVIIGLACSEPEESCFCSTFGIDCTSPECDIVCRKVGEELLFEALTEKGISALAITDGITTDSDEKDEKDIEVQNGRTKEITAKLPFRNLDLSFFKEHSEKEVFADKRWAELSDSCLGCGACTFVCPTCQCFDVRDFVTDKGVVRYRCWDSCMYSDFTQMAAANSRTTQLQRYRQRFMHKLVYYPANNDGLFSCVGCGRCVEKCPQKLNIVKVIRKMGGKK